MTIIEDDKIEIHTLNYLDNPNMVPKLSSIWTYGEFDGPVPSEIVNVTGIQKYNLKMDSGTSKPFGVLNKDGTQIHFLGLRSGSCTSEL